MVKANNPEMPLAIVFGCFLITLVQGLRHLAWYQNKANLSTVFSPQCWYHMYKTKDQWPLNLVPIARVLVYLSRIIYLMKNIVHHYLKIWVKKSKCNFWFISVTYKAHINFQAHFKMPAKIYKLAKARTWGQWSTGSSPQPWGWDRDPKLGMYEIWDMKLKMMRWCNLSKVARARPVVPRCLL